VSVESVPSAQAIVVLGGALGSPSGRHPGSELVEASDRYLHALRLYRAGKAPLVVCSGGDLRGEAPESQFAAQLLSEWGVPPAAVLLEDRSRNTKENALFTRELLARREVSRILLVTSAAHMNRAAALFRKVGLEVIPAAADYQSGWREQELLLNWLPNAGALEQSSMALKEWMGLAACRVMREC